MHAGYEDLARARQVLVRAGLPAAERLVFAWPFVWKAMFYEPQWPATLRQRAGELVERMLMEGEASASVAAMEEAEAQALVSDLGRFIDDFGRHGAAEHRAEIRTEPVDRQRDTIEGH